MRKSQSAVAAASSVGDEGPRGAPGNAVETAEGTGRGGGPWRRAGGAGLVGEQVMRGAVSRSETGRLDEADTIVSSVTGVGEVAEDVRRSEPSRVRRGGRRRHVLPPGNPIEGGPGDPGAKGDASAVVLAMPHRRVQSSIGESTDAISGVGRPCPPRREACR